MHAHFTPSLQIIYIHVYITYVPIGKDTSVTQRKRHRPGIAPNANTTHVPTIGKARDTL